MYKPRVYLASKFQRGLMWRTLAKSMHEFEISSTWFLGSNVGKADSEPPHTQLGNWTKNREQVWNSDLLIAYGEANDKLNGTMIEIGMAVAWQLPIYLVGDYPWATWTALPHIKRFTTIAMAVAEAKKDFDLD